MHAYQADRYFIAFGERYRNIWQAYERMVGTEHNVQPYLEDDTFKNLQGTKIDLDRDYESELVAGLFDRYKNINLLYSGGVDSHTIAVKARQQGLEFDRYITFSQSFASGTGMDTIHMNEGIKEFFGDDPKYIVVPNSVEWNEKVYLNSDWWLNGGDISLAPISRINTFDIYNPDELYVAGMEKPFLIYHKGEWYMYFQHNSMGCLWDQPNVLYFFGLNEFCPEIAVASARKARRYYIERCGVPSGTKWVNYKNFIGTPESDDYIRGYNSSIGRYNVRGSNHDVDQGAINVVLSKRGIERLNQLCVAGREDIAMKFVTDCNKLYHRYPQIEWEFPAFDVQGRIPWLLNLDSLEFIPGDKLNDILDN